MRLYHDLRTNITPLESASQDALSWPKRGWETFGRGMGPRTLSARPSAPLADWRIRNVGLCRTATSESVNGRMGLRHVNSGRPLLVPLRRGTPSPVNGGMRPSHVNSGRAGMAGRTDDWDRPGWQAQPMMGPPRIAGHTDDGIAADGEPYRLTGPARLPGGTAWRVRRVALPSGPRHRRDQLSQMLEVAQVQHLARGVAVASRP